ncbi:thiamine biosynthesis lipoprotein [Enterococcus faecium]|uniref:FAD:protein FMN transferase n=2 Tax=Enterococcus TaxID=1350 RepID=I3U5L6_ENTFD|nr:thiamine biosynthesis lipoprotein [Enterococcus faecium DO]EFS08512.1 ApbE family protein [Enterococcus faecium TX0082]EJX39784.1 ApbE family protein [Enterococcus faecium R501]EJX64906.1 ApbE family protein [Enterococcus faecium P1190]EJX77424.1 ApbE family protein [Enterococcus faecium P1123]EJX78928.1 ApbE family protein [Enterococcus faecium P1139]EJX84838.1 ApbE family protein [Enterococcus faecium ERV69]EJX87191.1 ApbE family protein [Enterococcus faecium ERV38]EJX96211.1 ApbE fami
MEGGTIARLGSRLTFQNEERKKMRKKLLFSLITLGISFMVLTGCSNSANKTTTESSAATKILKDPYSDEQFLLGTYVRIRVYDEGKESTLKPAFDRVKELGDKITINQKGSEIDEVNEQAGIKPVKVSDDVYTLVKRAYEYSQDSQGGFDMAIGAITQLWRIGFDDARKPSQEEIDQALKLVDYHKIELNDKEKTVYLKEKGMIIDLGAIAKGYITDEVVKVLKKQGVTTAIVDLGGNVYVLGHSPRGENQDWTVGIQDPNMARGSVLGSIKERNKTLVTSGIYERYLEVDGKKYHHLFDPKTGYPFDNDIASVTIITDKSIDGDGLSTAVFSMGVKKGLEYVESELNNGTEAIFVTKDDKVYVTDPIKDTFKLSEDSHYTMGDRSELK